MIYDITFSFGYELFVSFGSFRLVNSVHVIGCHLTSDFGLASWIFRWWGLNRDPPPSMLELGRLRRGSKKLTPEFNGSQNYQPKDEWGEATVRASFKDGPQDVLN